MEDQDKKRPEISRKKFLLTLFVTYFFRSFIFLIVPGVACLLIGIFKWQFLIAGGALLLLDLILSLFCVIKTGRMKGSLNMFNMIVQAAADEAAKEGSYSNSGHFSDEEDLYSERALELRHEAAEAKTVREVFELYKKDIADMALTDETYTVYIKKEKYFFDEQMHYVISFDRMREINDDMEHHMYMDILYERDKFDGRINELFECDPEGDKPAFFEKVGSFLESNELMDLPAEDINVGASF